MRPVQANGGGEFSDVAKAKAYLNNLHSWETQRDNLIAAQNSARQALDEATQRATMLTGWAANLQSSIQATAQNASTVTAKAAAIDSASAAIASLDGEIADATQAYEIATARLLGGPAATVPLVLLPLRLETHWDAGTLQVRIYPDVVGVDSHQPKLTDAERQAGNAFWQLRARPNPDTGAVDQAWAQLARKVGAQRAAWIVVATDPAGAPPQSRATTFDIAVVAPLLPDRFAVVALSGGDPINVAASGAPAKFVTWTNAVQRDALPLGLLDAPGSPSWMTDFSAATAAGMAVAISIPAAAPAIDTLLVVGVRSGDTPDLTGLLAAHAYTDSAEILADGVPSNNSSEITAAHSRGRDESVARALIEPPPASAPPDGSAGAQLADALGIARAALTRIAGAHQPRAAAAQAMNLIVADGAQGALAGRLASPAAWPLATPGGPVPTLRLARQPYGVLPVTAPSRWLAQAGESGAALQTALNRWGQSIGPGSEIDPLNPPQHLGSGSARCITRDDDSQLAQLLVEAASSVTYQANGNTLGGADAIVGPVSGDQSPAAALQRLASTSPANLHSIAPPLPPTLLMRVALAAKQHAAALPAPQSGPEVAKVDAALQQLATLAGASSGREDLLRLLTETMDAASHRFDAWITGVVAERLTKQRAAAPTARVGAYAWLTDVHAGTGVRSHGHLLAPSLGHAATAAVLRSSFLGQRAQAWAKRIADAEADAAAAQALVGQREAELAQLQTELPSDKRQSLIADMQTKLAQARQAATAAEKAVTTSQQLAAELAPLDPAIEADLPLSIDLTSTRVREGRRTLRAVRAGQPLAAVLGYQFERDLADAGLERYLAAFRKLSRFQTGSTLELLEDARRATLQSLASAQAKLASLQSDAASADQGLAGANASVQAASAALSRAQALASPWHALQNAAAAINLAADQAAIDAAGPPPKPAVRGEPRVIPSISGGAVNRTNYTLELTDPDDAATAIAWQKRVTQARLKLSQDQARLTQIQAQLATPMAVAQLTAETNAQTALAQANAAQQTAQERAQTADQAAASFAANELQQAQAAVDAATRAISDALAALLAGAQTSTALTATVDGVALRARYRAALAASPPLWDHTTIPFRATAATPPIDLELSFPAVGDADYGALRTVLDQLDAHVDTVADLITGESVHQLVQGNSVRSGAALEIAASGSVPDDLEVIRTPRTGYDTTHRVLVLVDPALQPAWALPAPDAASLGDPLLAAWISRHLPDPAHSQVTVRRLDPDTGQAGSPVTLSAAEITVDPLTWIRLAADPAELEQRVAHAARGRWSTTLGGAAAGGRAVIDPPGPPFAELVAAAAALRGLLAPTRALMAADLTPPSMPATGPASPDVAALVTRLQSVEALVGARADALTKAAGGTDIDALIDALFAASALGEAGATPLLVEGTPALETLRAQATAAAARLHARNAGAPFTADANDPAGTLARARQRLSSLSGMALPGLISVQVPSGGHLRDDLADKPTRLAHASPLEIRQWLPGRARVRPAICAFLRAYEAVETLAPAGAHLDVRATQNPDTAGTPPPWVGLEDTPPPGGMNAVVQRSFSDPLPDKVAGLFVDEWTEVIPKPTHAPAVAFHYNRPNSTPAQAILVAVAPDTSAARQPTSWDLDTLLDTLTSTLVLARDRAVTAEAHPDAGLTISDLQ